MVSLRTPTRRLGFTLFLCALIHHTDLTGQACAKTRDLVATPGLMDSPVARFDSRMRDSAIQRHDSRMRESPTQLIGNPFGPYRFATSPNLQEAWASRQAAGGFPAMVQTIDGTVLVLPPYVIPPFPVEMLLQPGTTDESEAVPVVQPRPAGPPKIISLHCGKPLTLAIPPDTMLSEVEASPCPSLP
jgi:hypothetical protein